MLETFDILSVEADRIRAGTQLWSRARTIGNPQRAEGIHMISKKTSVPNEVLLLESRLVQLQPTTFPESSDDEFFMISSIDTVLRERGLSYQQIEEGVTEGTNDGGIDAVYCFLNGTLVQDEDVQTTGSAILELEIIQVKNERGFKEIAVQRLIDHLPVLLQLDSPPELKTEFNDRLLERFEIFKSAYLRNSSHFPDIKIRVRYITKSTDEPNAKVLAKSKRLQEGLGEALREADTEVFFIGAEDLNNLARQRLKDVLELRVSEGPISAEKGGFACLVKLSDWYQFISGDDGRLRDEIFEENVRGYEGDTVINKGIGESLSEGGASTADFWWLNNGVTVLGNRVQTPSKRLIIEDPQIVNGLQTSRAIYQHFSSIEPEKRDIDDRHLLIRVIEAEDDTVVSRIIKATNSQNRVSLASLRATEPFQRDIEEYFLREGYFNERKKNHYKNSGKPRGNIIEVLELAQAVSAILQREPHISRGQPSALVRDSRYPKIFNSASPLHSYLNCVLIMRRIDDYLEQRALKRQDRGNIRFQLARGATALALSSSRPQATAIAAVRPDKFDDHHLDLVLTWVVEARRATEKSQGISDFNLLAKSAEWSKEMDRRLSRYTAKSRWPKRISSTWDVRN